MAGRMDWIAVSVDLADHPKVAALELELGEERVEAYLVRLWAFCGRLVSDGILRGDSAEISAEKASGWRGPSGTLVDALLKTGWLDRTEDGLRVHDWKDHAGRLIEKAEKERARKRTAYQSSGSILRGDSAEIPRKSRGDSALSPPIEVEVEREVEKIKTLAPSRTDSPPAAGIAPLPCVGDGAHEFSPTEAQVAEWRTAFPAVDVLAELRKAGAWLNANPAKRKTARGMPRFLVAWLGRAQDSPQRAAAAKASRPDPNELQRRWDADPTGGWSESPAFARNLDGPDSGKREGDLF